MTGALSAIRGFWFLFQQRALALVTAQSADDPVYDELLEKLQGIDPGLFLEFSAAPDACELIITADGDRSLFQLARRVVAEAPVVSGWAIRALKPRLGFPETVRWETLTIRIAEIMFSPMEDEKSNELALRIFIPGIGEKDTQNAHSAVLRALDHGLGEEVFAEVIQRTEVRPLPSVPVPGPLFPLDELYAFIQRREGRQKGDAG